MAAVDRRLGVVRRGATPAAPKPFNLPSQKLENHRLVPDVEIVPRGTCCWGNAGRSTLASSRDNDQTELAFSSSRTDDDGTEDHESKLQSGLVLSDQVHSPVENSALPLSVESSTLPESSTTCVMSAETLMACPHLGTGNSISKAGNSPAASDTDTFSESVARPSSSGGGSCSSVSPTVLVQEQKQFEERSEIFEAYPGDHEKVSNMQPLQETNFSSESQRGSQDFGYFEGFYSTQAPVPRPGMPYPNGPGMAFGTGLPPEAPQHYSFLGVPYYDSVKDKEIVVITMVGNPGYYGNYLPYSGFTDQYSRPMYGNVPLQFGHFEHFVGPQVSPDMNPMCSSEDSGFVSYDQDNFKQSYANGRLPGIMRRNNGVCFPTSLSTCELHPMSEDCNMPKRIGRHKAVTRNKKAASREASNTGFAPERRVTLLTKVSQHEVIISNMQRKSKYGGARQTKSTFAPHSSAQDVAEVPTAPQPAQPAQNKLEISACAPQAEAVISPMESSSALTVQVWPGASRSLNAHAPVESTDAAAVVEVVEFEKSCALNDPESFSAHGVSSVQASCRGSNNEDSSCLSSCSEPSATCVLFPSSVSATPSAPIMLFEAQNELEQQGSPPMGSTGTPCQLPVSSMENFCVPVDHTSEFRCVNNYGESYLDSPCNDLVESAVSMESASESWNDSTSASVLNEHMQESMQGLTTKKPNKKWRRKGFGDTTKLEPEEFNQKLQDSVVDKVASVQESSTNIPKDGFSTPGVESLSSSQGEVKPLSGPASLTARDKSAASSKSGHSMVSVVSMAPDGTFMDKNSKRGWRASSSSGGAECLPEICPDQVLDSSLKSAPAAGGQNFQSKTVLSGAGKKWRPKLFCEAGHKNSTSNNKTGRVVTTSNKCSPPVLDLGLANNCTLLKVTCDEHGIEDHKKELQVDVDSGEAMQDDGCNRVSITVPSVPKVSLADQTSEKPNPQTSQSEYSSEDVQGDGNKKPSHTLQEQPRSEDSSLTHGIRTAAVSSTGPEEIISWGDTCSRNVNLGKQGHAWRVVGKQMLPPKLSVASKPEEREQTNSAVKSKESVYFVQGAPRVSWRPKQSTAVCISNEGSMGGVKDNPSKSLVQYKGSIEGKEQGLRRPLSLKSNILNDDKRKAAQSDQSEPYSSINMERAKVVGNIHAVGIGLGKSHSLSGTCMRLERHGEFHVAKKVDRKGWVVKSETACSKA